MHPITVKWRHKEARHTHIEQKDYTVKNKRKMINKPKSTYRHGQNNQIAYLTADYVSAKSPICYGQAAISPNLNPHARLFCWDMRDEWSESSHVEKQTRWIISPVLIVSSGLLSISYRCTGLWRVPWSQRVIVTLCRNLCEDLDFWLCEL